MTRLGLGVGIGVGVVAPQWSPRDIPGCIAFYHWNVVALSGRDVVTWYDQVGSYNATGAVGKRPTLDAMNCVLEFATTDVLLAPGVPHGAESTTILCATEATVSNAYLLNILSGPAIISRFVGNSVEYYWSARSTYTASPGAGLHTFAFSHRDSGFTTKCWYDGAVTFDSNDYMTQSGLTGLALGGADATPMNPFAGKMRTAMVFSRRLDTSEIEKIHSWCVSA